MSTVTSYIQIAGTTARRHKENVMGWKYEQSTGKMYKDGKLIETGYSGALTNKNNPDRQHVKGLGPLPAGRIKSRVIRILKDR